MRLVVISALSVVGLFSACSKDNPAPLVPAAGTVQAVDQAINDMATARCDREQRCNKIGESKEYSDRNHCMTVMSKEAGDSLNKCHKGVDQGDMRQCLVEIRNEDCSGLFSELGEKKACGMDDLCSD